MNILSLLLKLVPIAKFAKATLPFVLLLMHLKRQFVPPPYDSETLQGPKKTSKAGYVYIARRQCNSTRFKMGYRSRRPWRDSGLRVELGRDREFVLVFPATDAKSIERKLRSAYAKGSSKSQWFTLSQAKQREIVILAAVVQVLAKSDLGMAPVDDEIIELAKEVLPKLMAVAKGILAAKDPLPKLKEDETGSKKAATDDGWPAIPDFDWSWESVSDKDYRRLPNLKGKEAYLTVIRDNNARLGKIFVDDYPAESIDAALAERPSPFPLEIVLILKVANKKKAKLTLLASSGDRDANEWVDLADESLGEVRKLAIADWHGDSIYVGPKSHFGLETLQTEDFRGCPKLDRTAGYVCVVQGVKPGQHFKIWRNDHPYESGGIFGMPGQLNNPHDALHSTDPVKYGCVIRSEHAKSFEVYLKARYSEFRSKIDWLKLGDWYKLDEQQLQDIRDLGM